MDTGKDSGSGLILLRLPRLKKRLALKECLSDSISDGRLSSLSRRGSSLGRKKGNERSRSFRNNRGRARAVRRGIFGHSRVHTWTRNNPHAHVCVSPSTDNPRCKARL